MYFAYWDSFQSNNIFSAGNNVCVYCPFRRKDRMEFTIFDTLDIYDVSRWVLAIKSEKDKPWHVYIAKDVRWIGLRRWWVMFWLFCRAKQSHIRWRKGRRRRRRRREAMCVGVWNGPGNGNRLEHIDVPH